MINDYQTAKIQNREALRRGLLDAASRILVNEGLEALSMRRVAQEVHASTQVLYTLFGSKEGLFEQLYLEGFNRLGQNLNTVGNDTNPLARLLNLGRAYRQFGLANPTYFAVLFSRIITGFNPSPEVIHAALPNFDVFERCIQECIEAGDLPPANALKLGKVFCASIHGSVSLELVGYLAAEPDNPDLPDQIFELTMLNVIKGFSTSPTTPDPSP